MARARDFSDELSGQLQPLVAGNALAAQSIGGATSNIAEVIQEVSRIAGEPIFNELTGILIEVQDFLLENRDVLEDFASEGAEDFLTFARVVVDTATSIGQALVPAIQAIAHEAHANIPHVLESLGRALNLAEPEGYVRLFVDEGEPMRNLLRQAAAVGIAAAYTRRLLSVFNDESIPPVSTPAQATKLVEPLTARENEILRLIAVGMRNQEIADQLFISLATVKRHIANTYGKLGASHRTEAVARANELNLL